MRYKTNRKKSPKKRFHSHNYKGQSKKRLQDEVKYNDDYVSIAKILDIDPLYIWGLSYEKKYIRLAHDAETELLEVMQRKHLLIYNMYKKNKREKDELIQKKEVLAKKYNTTPDKITLKKAS